MEHIWVGGTTRVYEDHMEVISRVCRVCGFAELIDPPTILQPIAENSGRKRIMIEIRPIKWRTARRCCEAHHYLGPPVGHKFSLGVYGPDLLGVMTWGRPVSRMLDDGHTLEMTRFCLMVQQKNLASQSLSKAVQWIKFHRTENRLISYSDGDHKGTIYAAANWTPTPFKKPAPAPAPKEE